MNNTIKALIVVAIVIVAGRAIANANSTPDVTDTSHRNTFRVSMIAGCKNQGQNTESDCSCVADEVLKMHPNIHNDVELQNRIINVGFTQREADIFVGSCLN